MGGHISTADGAAQNHDMRRAGQTIVTADRHICAVNGISQWAHGYIWVCIGYSCVAAVTDTKIIRETVGGPGDDGGAHLYR